MPFRVSVVPKFSFSCLGDENFKYVLLKCRLETDGEKRRNFQAAVRVPLSCLTRQAQAAPSHTSGKPHPAASLLIVTHITWFKCLGDRAKGVSI